MSKVSVSEVLSLKPPPIPVTIKLLFDNLDSPLALNKCPPPTAIALSPTNVKAETANKTFLFLINLVLFS